MTSLRELQWGPGTDHMRRWLTMRQCNGLLELLGLREFLRPLSSSCGCGSSPTTRTFRCAQKTPVRNSSGCSPHTPQPPLLCTRGSSVRFFSAKCSRGYIRASGLTKTRRARSVGSTCFVRQCTKRCAACVGKTSKGWCVRVPSYQVAFA